MPKLPIGLGLSALLLGLLLLPSLLHAQEGTLLTPNDPAWGDLFGQAVAISGKRAVVGAVYDDDGCVQPDCNTGSAYVFEQLTGELSSWDQIVKLTAFDAQEKDFFGGSVAIDGDTIIVGAHGSDIAGASSGAAYVFGRNQGGPDNWGFVTQLVGSTTAADDDFGAGVAIEGDLIAVASRGGTFLFERDLGGIGAWGERTVVAPGTKVALSGDTLVVGQYFDDSASPADPNCQSGAAVVLGRNVGGPDSWGEIKTLLAPTPMCGGDFGRSVAVDQNTVAVGAIRDSDGLFNGGAAYVFERNLGGPDTWGFSKKLLGTGLKESDRFGESVSLEGDWLVVGTLAANCQGHVDAGAVFLHRRNLGGSEAWGERLILCSQDLDWGEYFGGATDIENELVIAGSVYDAVNCPEPKDPNCSTGSASVYKLGIFADGFESGDVSKWTAEVDYDDHGNDASRATLIDVPSGTNGEIDFADDLDWFQLDLKSGTEYVFETNLGTLPDSVMSLYDTDGSTLLVQDDDSGSGFASRIEWTPPAAGRYFIEVKGFDAGNLGTYSLSVAAK